MLKRNSEGKITKQIFLLIPIYIFAFLLDYLLGELINTDILTLFIFFSFLFVIYVNRGIFFAKYFLLMFFFITNIVGVFVIENNVLWLGELQKISTRNKALLPITVLHWIFIVTVWLFDEIYGENLNNKIACRRDPTRVDSYRGANTIFRVMVVILVLAFVVFLIRVIPNPAFISGDDRVQYSKKFLTGIYRPMQGLFAFFSPLLGIFYANRRKKSFYIIVFLYFLGLFLSGVKFGAFIIAIFQWFPIIVYSEKKLPLKEIMKYILGVFFVLIIVVILHNKITYNYSISDNASYLEDRLAQQGQMWWAIYGNESGGHANINEIDDEINSWFKWNAQNRCGYNFGIYKMMKKVTTDTMFSYKISNGWRYASSTEATVYYYFRFGGSVVYCILFGIIYGMIINLYWGAFRSTSIVNTLIAGKFVTLIQSVVTQSDFDRIFSIKVILYLSVWLLYYYCYSHNRMKRVM